MRCLTITRLYKTNSRVNCVSFNHQTPSPSSYHWIIPNFLYQEQSFCIVSLTCCMSLLYIYMYIHTLFIHTSFVTVHMEWQVELWFTLILGMQPPHYTMYGSQVSDPNDWPQWLTICWCQQDTSTACCSPSSWDAHQMAVLMRWISSHIDYISLPVCLLISATVAHARTVQLKPLVYMCSELWVKDLITMCIT